jgi:DNA-directed RNA polymerase subunit RPC12/RpoP
MAKKTHMFCKNCGFRGKPREMTRGTFAVEVLLWLCFLLPGLLYTLWRSSNRYTACPKCGHENMIPLDSPMGQKSFEDKEFYRDLFTADD